MAFNFVKGVFVKAYLGKLANSNDTKATILGVIAAGLLAAKVDFGKLFTGDANEWGNVAFACTVAGIGFYTNKKEKEKEVSK